MKQVEVQLHLEAGSVALTEAEWKGVMPGDFIILDRCSYDPESQKGSVTLMLGNTPLLRGRIKPEGIKVLEYAFYFEDQAPIDMGGAEQIGEGDGENFGEVPLPPEEEQLWAASSAEEEMETAIAPQEASVSLTVDVGYIRMTIGKLLELKPDTLLDLSMKPEHGIDAAIGGKQIGKGELIKLGQLLGIRLLDIER
jgi:flagellar motor switch protein FliN/FliY